MDAKSNNNNNNKNKLRTLVLSTNVNDYDTGEPVLKGSIRKTTRKNKKSFRIKSQILNYS